ncbi:MAG: prefoldin subunit beta [archaeon]
MSSSQEEQIGQLQMMEQNITNIMAQKQQFQSQLMEVETALEEMKSSQKVYKIVGNVMVARKKEDVKKELDEKKEMFNIRIKALDKQEKDVREKAEEIQKKVLASMKKEKK